MICGPASLLARQEGRANRIAVEESETVAQFLGTHARQNPTLARAASPVTHVTRDDAPMLLIYGTRDKIVPIWHGEILREAIARQGAKGALIKVEGAGHLNVVKPEAAKVISGFLREIAEGRAMTLRDATL